MNEFISGAVITTVLTVIGGAIGALVGWLVGCWIYNEGEDR